MSIGGDLYVEETGVKMRVEVEKKREDNDEG